MGKKSEGEVSRKSEIAFREWVGRRSGLLGSALNSSVPNTRTLLFLAILDTQDHSPDHWSNYQLVTEAIGNHGFESISKASLQVALAELKKALKRYNHSFELESEMVGRNSRFRLVDRGVEQSEVRSSKNDSVIALLDPPFIDPATIASRLIRDRHLPFWALYTLSRSSARWLSHVLKEDVARAEFEAKAVRGLGVVGRLARNVGEGGICSFVGLACGGGQGELAILRELLGRTRKGDDDGSSPVDPKFREVHYLAVDISPIMLTVHLEAIREVFGEELKTGRLRCAMVVGNVFDLKDVVDRARKAFAQLRIPRFFPDDPKVPVLATYLGNCLGNDKPDREWSIFAALLEAFPGRRLLEIVLGISVKQTPADTYNDEIYNFLLETPHRLMADLDLLVSGGPSDDPQPEFTLPEDGAADRLERCLPVPPREYRALNGIESLIYEFRYKTKYSLRLNASNKNRGMELPAGSELVLYAITKYDLESLKSFLQKQQFQVRHGLKFDQTVQTTYGKRYYAILSASCGPGAAPRSNLNGSIDCEPNQEP